MTDWQARQIRELRRHGKGYKAIASATGLNRDAVRYYCKANELDDVGSKAQAIQAQCPNCGKRLDQPRTGRKRRFCGEPCRRAWWAKHPDGLQQRESAVYHLTCAHCGKEFESYGNRNRRFCCRTCYFKARFQENDKY